jgi:hypothetical protein
MALPLFHGATIDEGPKLVLGVESHRHAALPVRDGDRELSAVAGVATALLNDRARQARVSAIVPHQNLHGAHLRSDQGRAGSEHKAKHYDFTIGFCAHRGEHRKYIATLRPLRLGDLLAVRFERDAVGFRTSRVQRVDRGELVLREFEIKDSAMFSAMRAGLVDFGMAERPSGKCQLSITCAGDLPCCRARASSDHQMRSCRRDGTRSSRQSVRWVEGEPIAHLLFSGVKLEGREPVPVTTYRC